MFPIRSDPCNGCIDTGRTWSRPNAPSDWWYSTVDLCNRWRYARRQEWIGSLELEALRRWRNFYCSWERSCAPASMRFRKSRRGRDSLMELRGHLPGQRIRIAILTLERCDRSRSKYSRLRAAPSCAVWAAGWVAAQLRVFSYVLFQIKLRSFRELLVAGRRLSVGL